MVASFYTCELSAWDAFKDRPLGPSYIIPSKLERQATIDVYLSSFDRTLIDERGYAEVFSALYNAAYRPHR